MTIPTQQQNPAGLHRHYLIKKADGESIDPCALYFVLRIDAHGADRIHAEASRAAARIYSAFVQSKQEEAPWLTRMGEELQQLIEGIEQSIGQGPTDSVVSGYLVVGIDPDRHEVVVNLDYERTGHITFSPEQARELAATLLRKADEAEATRQGA